MRAFILGAGKSLDDTDLDKLEREVTFGMNQCHFIYPTTKWRPTYYLFFENVGSGKPNHRPSFTSYVSYVTEEMLSGRRCFISEHLMPSLMEYTRYKPFPNVTYVPYRCDHMKLDINYPGKPFLWHLPNLCHYGGTMNIALQQAFMMGYDPVYLVACDLGYIEVTPEMNEDPNHFHPDYWTWTDNDIFNMDETLNDMHSIAKKEYDAADRKIYNATVGGELEVYKRVDFDSLF